VLTPARPSLSSEKQTHFWRLCAIFCLDLYTVAVAVGPIKILVKIAQVWPHFRLCWATTAPVPLYLPGQIWYAIFHVDRFLVSPLLGEKSLICSNLNQISTFWGLWCQSPFTDLDQIRCQTVDPPSYTHMPNFIRIRLLRRSPQTKKLGNFPNLGAAIPSQIWCTRVES